MAYIIHNVSYNIPLRIAYIICHVSHRIASHRIESYPVLSCPILAWYGLAGKQLICGGRPVSRLG